MTTRRWVVGALALAACVSKDKAQKKIDPAYVAANVLAAEPATIQHRAGVDFDGKVLYLGCDVQPDTLSAGGDATVVHYWKVVEPPGDDWRVFSHLTGGGDDWMNLDYSDMRTGYPPGKWKAGDVIRDEQKFQLPAEWKSGYAQLSVGLYRKGSSSVDDRMPVVSGKADKERRALAVRFKVNRGGARAGAAPEYQVRRARGAIAIDGVASEADWAAAADGPAFTAAEGGPKLGGSAVGKLLWDDTSLYVFVSVKDDEVHSEYEKQDDTLWKQDVVEMFIDADRNRHGYVELQVNPRNAHFDAWFPQTRAQPHHFEWQSGMKSAVVMHGTLDDRDDTDSGWDVEIAIPLADVKGMEADMKVTIPPAPGDTWRVNLIRVDQPEDGNLGASSWSPITIQDFHALGRMFSIVFAD
jgi:hypothetical protein